MLKDKDVKKGNLRITAILKPKIRIALGDTELSNGHSVSFIPTLRPIKIGIERRLERYKVMMRSGR